jgi:SAM-dependent methyltransferase
MHPAVFREFERICRERRVGGAVLEVGAVPSRESLLCLEALAGATERVGIDLAGPARFDGFEILRGDANAMDCFPSERFDAVLCNSVLEHDPLFWRALAEMRRVAKRGALIAIGVPGYARSPRSRALERLRWVGRLPVVGARLGPRIEARLAATPTLLVHDFPGDYYRFSPQAMREVLLEGLAEVEVRVIMDPPRVIGAGVKA